jgi:hypothetical protein
MLDSFGKDSAESQVASLLILTGKTPLLREGHCGLFLQGNPSLPGGVSIEFNVNFL